MCTGLQHFNYSVLITFLLLHDEVANIFRGDLKEKVRQDNEWFTRALGDLCKAHKNEANEITSVRRAYFHIFNKYGEHDNV